MTDSRLEADATAARRPSSPEASLFVVSFLRPIARLLVGPAVVAGFAAFELRRAGPLAAAAGAYAAFAASVLAISAWEQWQLRLVKRRLKRIRSRRSPS